MDYNNKDGNDRKNDENRKEYGKRPRIKRITSNRTQDEGRTYGNRYSSGEKHYNSFIGASEGEQFRKSERFQKTGQPSKAGQFSGKGRSSNKRRSSRSEEFAGTERFSRTEKFSKPGNHFKSVNYHKSVSYPKSGNSSKSGQLPSENGIDRMIRRKQQMDSFTYSDNDLISIPAKEEIRLNKFIANSGICSRREADNYIQAGVVTVNGNVVTELGTKINVNNDDVRFNGERLKGEQKVYLILNKPKGFVTTASDPHAEKTVMDLIKGCNSRVFPVGRLDKNTTGVLMFTNDGEMAEKLTHPSYSKKKIYQVTLDNKLSAEDFDRILSGISLSDGVIAADALEYIDENDQRKVGMEIHSGRNRIVRRIFESLGYKVTALDRVYFAGLTKKGLKRGHWRYLTEGEVNILKMGAFN